MHYQPGVERSLDLDVFLENEKRSLDLTVFLEREKSLKLEVERLGKSPDQIQSDVQRDRDESIRKLSISPPPVGEAPR